MYTRNAFARQFVVSWVAVLDAVPDIDLVSHLPDLLDGLFKMLDDPNPEIRRMCDVQLNEFLRSIKKDPSRVDFQAMVNILITHAQSPEEMLQLAGITWIKEFVELSGAALLPHASGVLAAVLPALAYTDEPRKSIRETAATVNFQLTRLVGSESRETTPSQRDAPEHELKDPPEEEQKDPPEGEAGKLRLDAVVGVLTQMLHHSSVHTKVASLDWILHLYNKMPTEMFAETDAVFVSVVGSLTDASDDVVRRALAVLAEICSCGRGRAPPGDAAGDAAAGDAAATAGDLESSPYYYKFLQSLLRLLAADENLLEDRGAFIIRQLCVLLNAEAVYRALALLLRSERNLRFAATVVDVLSTMLLTAAELCELRLQLRAQPGPATDALFAWLYPSWCHSPVSLLALCLLTHHYSHCNTLIDHFGDLEITVDFLTEVDKLVQLIESPIFAYLRLELLRGASSAELRGALYGLLMLLPQSDAFHTLRNRLQCAPPLPLPLPPARSEPEQAGSIDFEQLISEFKRVQAAHREYKALGRSRARLLDRGIE